MGLFGKKDKKNNKKIEPVVIDYDGINPYFVIMDVQNHLQIVQKQETPFFPAIDFSNKIPNPEIFKNSLENDIKEEDSIEDSISEIKEDKPVEKIEEVEVIKEDEIIEDAEIIEDTDVVENVEIVDGSTIVDENLKTEETIEDTNQEETIENSNEIASDETQAEDINNYETQSTEIESNSNLDKVDNIEENSKDNLEENKEEPKPKDNENIKSKIEPKQSSVVLISGLTAKKKGKLANINQVKSGGVAAAIAEAEKHKEAEEAKRRQIQSEKAAAIRAEEKAAEMARLATVTLIGKAKKPDPSLGKFEIHNTGDELKPYKFVLKTDSGKLIFETAPLRTKPNELSAIMFKDVLEKGSFVFLKSINGFTFKILDARKKEFCSSHLYKTALDAQKAAALIKKFGLSANYIDDLSK